MNMARVDGHVRDGVGARIASAYEYACALYRGVVEDVAGGERRRATCDSEPPTAVRASVAIYVAGDDDHFGGGELCGLSYRDAVGVVVEAAADRGHGALLEVQTTDEFGREGDVGAHAAAGEVQRAKWRADVYARALPTLAGGASGDLAFADAETAHRHVTSNDSDHAAQALRV